MGDIIPIGTDHVFYSNACQVCLAWGKDVIIRRCLRCQVMPYCSRKHQKEHWPEHQVHCYVIRKSISIVDPGYGNHKYEKYPEWTNTRLTMARVSQREFGRMPTFYEMEVILFPRTCEVCHETDPRKLIDCPDCPDASFCIEHKGDVSHSAKCKTSQIHFAANTMDTDLMDSVWDSAINFEIQYGKRPPRNMDVALKFFTPHCPAEITMKGLAALTSAFLSRPYTFLHSLELLSLPQLSTSIIHIIVQRTEELLYNDFWHLLLHHNLPFKVFKIFLVGKCLNNRSEEVELCVECMKKNHRIFIRSVQSAYSDFIVQPFVQKPDYVIGFNIHFSEDHSLAKSAIAVAHLGCPFILTTFIERHLKDNETRLNGYFRGGTRPFWTGRNLFSSRKPHKEMDHGGYFYHNQFLTVWKSLP